MTKGSVRLQELLEELDELGLAKMSGALKSAYNSRDFLEKDRLELIGSIVDAEYETRMSSRYNGRLKKAHLLGCPESVSNCVDSTVREYAPYGLPQELGGLGFISQGLNVCILGASDSGKSYLAKALGIKACEYFRVSYNHCQEFLEELVALKQSEFRKYQKRIRSIIKLDLLILDDFLLHTITDESELKVLFEVMEKRSELSRSTIVCSQRDPKAWASMMLKDEVTSNAILKRATKHYTVVINLKDND